MIIKWVRPLTNEEFEKELDEMERNMKFKDETDKEMDRTEAAISAITKAPTMEELEATYNKLIEDWGRNPEFLNALSKMRFAISPFVPDGEIWFVQEGLVKKIIDVGNSKPFRFICWYQRIFKKLRRGK